MKKDQYLDYPTFITRIKQHDCEYTKLDIIFNQSDHRCWSVLLSPNDKNIIVTYSINKNSVGNNVFDILTSERTYIDVEQDDIHIILTTLLGNATVTTIIESNEQ